MTDAVLRATGVARSFPAGPDDVRVLDRVDLEVGRGEMLAVTGPSGSGKTTLLHCLSGILEVDQGRVWIADSEVTGASEAARAALRRAHMGFLFQRLNLLPALTVAENVQLPLVLRGDDRDTIATRTDEVLGQVGLSGRGHARLQELSGGQTQRAALARAVIAQPDVVFADEPTGQLDRVHADEVADLLREVADRGRTVVLVTHDEGVAARAHRRLRLVDGRLEV